MAQIYLTYTASNYIRPRDFDYWRDARKVARELYDHEWDRVEDYIYDALSGKATDGELNAFLWSHADDIAIILGYENWNDLRERKPRV